MEQSKVPIGASFVRLMSKREAVYFKSFWTSAVSVIVVFVVLFACVVGSALHLCAKFEQLGTLRYTTKKQQDTLAHKKDVLRNLNENKVALEAAQEKLNAQRFVVHTSLPAKISALQKALATGGILCESFIVGAEQPTDVETVFKTPITISGTGDYFAVRGYLDTLFAYEVQNLHLSSLALQKEGDVYFMIDVQIYSFVPDSADGGGSGEETRPERVGNPFYYGGSDE